MKNGWSNKRTIHSLIVWSGSRCLIFPIHSHLSHKYINKDFSILNKLLPPIYSFIHSAFFHSRLLLSFLLVFGVFSTCRFFSFLLNYIFSFHQGIKSFITLLARNIPIFDIFFFCTYFRFWIVQVLSVYCVPPSMKKEPVIYRAFFDWFSVLSFFIWRERNTGATQCLNYSFGFIKFRWRFQCNCKNWKECWIIDLVRWKIWQKKND